MSTKTPHQPDVGFYSTSPRIAHAYRIAANRNKILARFAVFRELGRATAMRKVFTHIPEPEMVVLSHVDEDHRVLTDAHIKPVISGAFHLLFTEPSTHPDQVAWWTRATKIQSENRLHVVKIDDLEAPQMSQLLGRVYAALGRDGPRGSIIDAYFAGEMLLVRGPKHRMLHVPASSVPVLNGQPRDVLRNFEIDPDGSFIHWPELDAHLGWDQFLQSIEPAELRKAQQRSAEFNRRYGAAMREVREASGILQSKVEGLTDRQLRRIEQGECRATPAAIAALARAHGTDANVYMNMLSNAMR